MIELQRSGQLLVVLPNWLGDVAMATPALRALFNRFSGVEVAVAGPPGACALLDGVPFVSRAYPVQSKATGAWLRSALGTRSRSWDAAIVFPHSFRAALLARISGSPIRIGYARDGRSRLLTHAIPPYCEDGKIAPIYMAREYLELIAQLGCEDDGKGLELATNERDLAAVREHIPEGGPLVGFAPGAAFGPSKRWLPERFAAVADRLREEAGARCILLTGPGEDDTRRAIQSAAKRPLLICDEGHPSIASLKATISQLDLLVCNDSGPRHVAVAFNVPTICIMGPTRPAYSCGPHERGEVLRVEVDCGPCQKPVCTTDHRCMTRIQVDTVVNAALAQLPHSRV